MRNKTIIFFIIVSLLLLIASMCDFAIAAESAGSVDADFIGKILDTFYNKTNAWASKFKGYALTLFRYMLTIDLVVFGILSVLKRTPLEDFLAELLKMIFIASLMMGFILYYKELSDSFVDGFLNIGGAVGYSSEVINPSSFMQAGFSIATKLWAQTSFADLASVSMLISGLVILVCFALMAARIIQITCEYYIVMNAGIIFLGFGACGYLRDYAINVLKFVLVTAAKLFVLELLLGLCMSFVDDMMSIPATLEGAGVMIGVALVMAVLANTIPDVMGGMLHGASVSTGNALATTIQTAATAGAAAALTLMAGGGGALRAGADAFKAAGAEGHSGVGRAGHAAAALAKSSRDAFLNRPLKDNSYMDRVRSGLGKRAQEAKVKNESE